MGVPIKYVQGFVEDGRSRRDALVMTPVMPCSPQTEEHVLSVALTREDAQREIVSRMQPDDFWIPGNRMVFEAMCAAAQTATMVTVFDVKARLELEGRLDMAGGLPRLIELEGPSVSILTWTSEMTELRHLADRRRLMLSASGILEDAQSMQVGLPDLIARADGEIRDVIRDLDSDMRPWDEVVDEGVAAIEAVNDADGLVHGATTGFSALDEVLLGLRPGTLTIVGARPSIGKSTFANHVAVAAAKAGTPVVLFTLEVAGPDIAEQMLLARMGVSRDDVMFGGLDSNGGWMRRNLGNATEEISSLPIYVCDRTDVTVADIRAIARRELDRPGIEGGIVIVDYLQLLSSHSSGQGQSNRALEIADMSRSLKVMAGELGVAVIALSQLNRSVEMRADRQPRLSDLRESGAIEQDADVVLLLDRSRTRDEAMQDGRPSEGEFVVDVAKHRRGPTARVSLHYNIETMVIEDDPELLPTRAGALMRRHADEMRTRDEVAPVDAPVGTMLEGGDVHEDEGWVEGSMSFGGEWDSVE